MTPLARLGRYSYWIIGISLTAATMTLLTQQASSEEQVNPRLTEDHHSSSAWSEQQSDSALLAKVKTRLLANINLPGARIAVDTQQGHVTLSGEVDHRDQQELAYYTTLNTQGVRSVESTLNVTPKEE
ncbi:MULTISPECIES: BON domain-containing protein [unclassified Marinimicrobium]|jgi:osmotically-inducible protein OsmY|uniref:BON domain-containing protein n=1 Tax=Marinimicrobium TaxID=359337 RepID=UPI000C386646|nr:MULTISPECIES: BON domain-containing protein [unclassified Marinimicrobium]MAN52098.1 hypothetical protein [Marinimicrobium sp.]|tara:strand:- start:323 stop:706 length:384 start_codon:yes stop_codon:yes gene_type:complete